MLCCPRNQFTKNQIDRINRSHKNLLLKKKKNQNVYNGRTGILVMIIELLRFLNDTLLLQGHRAKFEIDRTTKKTIRHGRTYGRTDPNYRKASLLKI